MPLAISGTKFVAGGKEVELRGAVAPHFLWEPTAIYNHVSDFAHNVTILKDWGGNFVSVPWNSGFLNDPEYVTNLVTGLEYAKELGLRVELVLHSRGLSDPKNIYSNEQVTLLNEQVVKDWDALLNDQTIASKIADSTDIFGILSEPVDSGTKGIRASLRDPILDMACGNIRARLGTPNAICAYSGPDNGGNARELLGTRPTKANVAIEVHPYRWIAEPTGFSDYVVRLRRSGYNVFVGEMGCKDPPEFVRNQVDFLKQQGISFAFWGMVNATECELLHLNNPTSSGQILMEALKH